MINLYESIYSSILHSSIQIVPKHAGILPLICLQKAPDVFCHFQ